MRLFPAFVLSGVIAGCVHGGSVDTSTHKTAARCVNVFYVYHHCAEEDSLKVEAPAPAKPQALPPGGCLPGTWCYGYGYAPYGVPAVSGSAAPPPPTAPGSAVPPPAPAPTNSAPAPPPAESAPPPASAAPPGAPVPSRQL